MENKVKETKSAGGVVINNEGRVLVISQHGTVWSLSKGHVDEGEEAIETAKREIYEESGITKLELIKELGVYQRYRIDKNGREDKSELKTITIFLFKTNQNRLEPLDPENPEARWVHKNEVANLLTHEKDKKFFLKIVEKI